MKRLLKISFDQALLSFIPVISWFILSLIVDKNLINIFTLTYPFQFIWYILKSIFSTGANISKEKDKNENATMSGMVLGIIVGFLIFGFILLHLESYIKFMNMDVSIYKTFAIYSVIQLYIQLVFAFILNKLYYEEKNTLANRYSFLFNLINFFVLIGSILLFKNITIAITITLICISVFTLVIAIQSFEKFKFKCSILKFIKYDSVELFNNIAFFFIFLFGLSNALEFGAQYALALTFIALITDTQWDTFSAITTAAQIDISKNKFNYKEHIKNAYKLLAILLFSVFFMFMVLYFQYELDFFITMIFLSFELVSFMTYPILNTKTCFLQLEYSAIKTTSNKIISDVLRMLISLLKTPYCTGLGQVSSSIYQFITVELMFNKHYKISKDGQVIAKEAIAPQNVILQNDEVLSSSKVEEF